MANDTPYGLASYIYSENMAGLAGFKCAGIWNGGK